MHICGSGDTIEGAIDDLKDSFEELSDRPVSIDPAGFADLLRDIEEAQKEGMKFSEGKIPEPEIAVK